MVSKLGREKVKLQLDNWLHFTFDHFVNYW